MDNITRLDSVQSYNDSMGVETLHPLVSMVNFEDCDFVPHLKPKRYIYGFYCIFLKDAFCGDMIYGQSKYDYKEGTMVFIAPGQVYGVNGQSPDFKAKGYALVFHPDLIRGTELGRNIKNYSFFSYASNEALHLSEQERHLVLECFHNILTELHHAIDKHTRSLIVSHLELLLNYCTRFYDRQFIMREDSNKDILAEFEQLLDNYFQSGMAQRQGFPSVKYCADSLNLSANYFGDLVKKETGKTAQEHIQLKLIDIAKERILDTGKSISEVAYELGFQYPQHFSRLFKKQVGMSPNNWRLRA